MSSHIYKRGSWYFLGVLFFLGFLLYGIPPPPDEALQATSSLLPDVYMHANNSGSDFAMLMDDRVLQVMSDNSVTQSSKYLEHIYICYS